MRKREEILWLALCLVIYAGAMALIMGATPTFTRIYAEMLAGEPLPLLTRLFCGIPTLVHLAMMVFGIGLVCMAHFTMDSSANRSRLRLSIVWFSVLLVVACAFALLRPLCTIIDGRLG